MWMWNVLYKKPNGYRVRRIYTTYNNAVVWATYYNMTYGWQIIKIYQ